MSLKIVQFVNLVFIVLVAGALWGTWLGLSRSMGTFSAATYLDIGHAMIANLAPVMPVLMLAAVTSGVLVVVMLYRERSTGFLPSTAGLALLFVVIAITVLFEVPVNNQVRAWTVTSLPVDWRDIRERWALLHLIRTFTSLAALGLFLGAAVFNPAPASRKQR